MFTAHYTVADTTSREGAPSAAAATPTAKSAPPSTSASSAHRRRRLVIVAVVLILAVSAGLRLWRLDFPAEYVFDEVYYAKDAKAIVDGRVGPNEMFHWMAGDAVSWPHPEMGKFAIAAGIVLFGDQAIGWRLPAVVAGMVMVACVYPIARRLGLSTAWALVALLFAAADPLGITQSRVATLDVFVASWTVLCVYLALRYVQDGRRPLWLVLCGAAGGMALATKWSGALALLAAALIIFGAWFAQRPVRRPVRAPAGPSPGVPVGDASRQPAGMTAATARAGESVQPLGRRIGDAVRAALPVAAALVIIPAAIYMGCYTQYFLSGHTFADWRELQRQMWVFGINLDATHSYASIAPSWIVDYRPVWYYFRGTTEYRGIVAIGNPFLWWAATAALVAAPFLALLRRRPALLVPAAIVAVLYLPWFATARTSFLYYMTPVAPFLAVLVAVALAQFAGTETFTRRRWLALAAAALATALLWYPVGIAGEWLFWTLPRMITPVLAWAAIGLGILAAVLAAIALMSHRLRRYRPLTAALAAGLVVGIVSVFLPVILAIPISPEFFSRITWFPSWI